MKISYIVPDFDENAYSSGLYVIFQHCNGMIGRGHKVRVFNNMGKAPKHLRLDCPVELHKNDPSIVEGDSPDMIVGTYWHTYFFINRMKDVVKNNTKLCFLVQSNDRAIYSEEDKQFINKAMTTKYLGVIPIHKIAISRYLVDMIKADYGQEAAYIRNGFDVREVTPLLPESKKIRIVSRYDPSTFRGWDVADKVLRRVAAERDDLEIHLFEMKEKSPTRYRSIFHKGLRGDVLLGLFKSCDIFLAGNRYEGFPYPIIEAMSQGACICCTDAGGNREYCIDGETALVSPRNDVERLYYNLLKLLNDKELRNNIRKNGINKTKEFSWKESLDKLENFFLSLASQDYKTIAMEKRTREGQVETGKDEAPGKSGKILLVYPKDPFLKYEDWDNLEKSLRYLAGIDFDVAPLLLMERRPAKSVKARLDMLLPPEEAAKFKYKVFYNKKLKLRLPLLPKPLFMMSIVFGLISNHFSREKKYTHVIVAEGTGRILGVLCKLLNIRFVLIKSLDNISIMAKISQNR